MHAGNDIVSLLRWTHFLPALYILRYLQFPWAVMSGHYIYVYGKVSLSMEHKYINMSVSNVDKSDLSNYYL